MEIFATKERQEILKDFGINYAVDMELNFVFKNKTEEKRAIKLLKEACEL